MRGSTSISLFMSSSLWVAIKEIRNRLVPGGTVGGRMGGIKIPFSKSFIERLTAPSVDPIMKGMIGLSTGIVFTNFDNCDFAK